MEKKKTLQSAAGGTVGSGGYTVKQGDCISNIAYSHGLSPDTIWNDPKNSDLKRERKDPNVLLPGDKVFIRDKEQKEESCSTEKRHCFKRKGVPSKLRLRLLDKEEWRQQKESENEDDGEALVSVNSDAEIESSGEPKPRAQVPYTLNIDGQHTSGKTDKAGYIEVFIPPNAREGLIIVEPGTNRETRIPLRLGHLDPISTIMGVKQRLSNLGYPCGNIDDQESAELHSALGEFQKSNKLVVTGKLDQQTRDKLKQVHES